MRRWGCGPTLRQTAAGEGAVCIMLKTPGTTLPREKLAGPLAGVRYDARLCMAAGNARAASLLTTR